jgi:hypothetical protein
MPKRKETSPNTKAPSSTSGKRTTPKQARLTRNYVGDEKVLHSLRSSDLESSRQHDSRELRTEVRVDYSDVKHRHRSPKGATESRRSSEAATAEKKTPKSRGGAAEADSEVLRCVSSTTVLAGFGYQLRGGPIGSDDTFELSKPIDESTRLEIFLSHSWRDPAFLKYLALCYHFNGLFAAAAAIVVGLLTFCIQRFGGLAILPHTPFFNIAEDLISAAARVGLRLGVDPSTPWADPYYAPPISISCQLFGAATFLLLVLFGHKLLPTKGVFFDKICIDQADASRKRAGILAMDKFISECNTMIALYNDDYFQRLWCCFEFAAGASVGLDVVLLPLWRAPVVLLTVLLLALARSIEWLGFLHGPGGYYSVCAPIFNFLPYCIFTGAAVVAAQQKAKLVKQLESFSANDTTCSAPRDRQEVEGAIARCFPSLARFEEAFREDGTAHARIMDHIKAQPGLLRVQDLCLALGIVWTLNAFDFMTFSSRIYGSGCLWTVLIALPSQVAAFLTHAKLVEALSLSTRLPAWLSVVMFSPLPIILVVPIMFPLSWAWIALFKNLL